MLLKIYGLLDLLTGIILLLLHFDIFKWNIAFGFAIYLFIKSFMYKGDIASFADLIVGVYIILMLIGFRTFLVYIFSAYLFQKAFFSLK